MVGACSHSVSPACFLVTSRVSEDVQPKRGGSFNSFDVLSLQHPAFPSPPPSSPSFPSFSSFHTTPCWMVGMTAHLFQCLQLEPTSVSRSVCGCTSAEPQDRKQKQQGLVRHRSAHKGSKRVRTTNTPHPTPPHPTYRTAPHPPAAPMHASTHAPTHPLTDTSTQIRQERRN